MIGPRNKPIYAPAGQGPTLLGLTDMELGAKIAYIKEGKYNPQIGTFTMFEMPTGNYNKGLGVGKVWYRLPLWLQKNIGPWLLDGGAGETMVPQTQYRNFPYGGFLLKYTFPGDRLEFGGEVFSHGREGLATPQTQASTLIDLGGYYHFKHNPNEQFLFCYGHSVAGQTENYAYVGMYWTWGKDDKKPDSGNALLGQAARPTATKPGCSGQEEGEWRLRRVLCGRSFTAWASGGSTCWHAPARSWSSGADMLGRLRLPWLPAIGGLSKSTSPSWPFLPGWRCLPARTWSTRGIALFRPRAQRISPPFLSAF